jgi:hypothetical protein
MGAGDILQGDLYYMDNPFACSVITAPALDTSQLFGGLQSAPAISLAKPGTLPATAWMGAKEVRISALP